MSLHNLEENSMFNIESAFYTYAIPVQTPITKSSPFPLNPQTILKTPPQKLLISPLFPFFPSILYSFTSPYFGSR
jgi:hypothetical protein